jgi:hypothetical protein
MDEEIQLKFEMRICFVLLQIKFEWLYAQCTFDLIMLRLLMNCKNHFFKSFAALNKDFKLPEKFWGAYCHHCVCPSVHPSVWTLSPKLLIRNWCCGQKMFLEKRGFVDHGISRSFWKVKGQFQHFFIFEFHFSSEIDHSWAYTLLGTKVSWKFLRGQSHSNHIPYWDSFFNFYS